VKKWKYGAYGCGLIGAIVCLVILQERLYPEAVVQRFVSALADGKTSAAYSCLTPQFQRKLGNNNFRAVLRDSFFREKDIATSDMFIRSVAASAKLNFLNTAGTAGNHDVDVEFCTPTQQMIQIVIQRDRALYDLYFDAYKYAKKGDSSKFSNEVRAYVYALALDLLRSPAYQDWIPFYTKKKVRVFLSYDFFRWKIDSYELL
jgi:hypothetical protein